MENHPVLDSSGNASPARQAPFHDHWPERSIGSDREEANAVGGSVKRAFGDALMTEDKMTGSPAQPVSVAELNCKTTSADVTRKEARRALFQRRTRYGSIRSNQFQTHDRILCRTTVSPKRPGWFETMGGPIDGDLLLTRIGSLR